jgi:hypothetical protein
LFTHNLAERGGFFYQAIIFTGNQSSKKPIFQETNLPRNQSSKKPVFQETSLPRNQFYKKPDFWKTVFIQKL